MRTTEGWLLDGRLRYRQPEDGYRTGIEPVLLAAGVPARPGQRVLEAGTGAGAALMCLAFRVPGITGVGVELDPEMAALAGCNVAENGLPGIEVVQGDLAAIPLPHGFHHALANPPWHAPGGTPSPLPRRNLAKQATGATWATLLRQAVRPGGSISLLLPAEQFGQAAAALRPAALTLLPFWPRAGRAARLVLLRATLRRGPDRVLPGLTLHDAEGYTPEAEAVLRGGAALPMT